MNESSSFTESDLKPFRARLNELREIVQHDRASGLHPEAMTMLLERKLNACGRFARVLLMSVPHRGHATRWSEAFDVGLRCLFLLLPFSDAVLTQLHDSLSVLSEDLIPIHQRLVALRRQLVALAAKPKPSKTDLKPLLEELRLIDQ